ncbi:hypothetical protein JCM19000A_35520 [Silvimonas sp. JCM 19000]
MDKFRVDFNEMVELDLVLFSVTDTKINDHGMPVTVAAGMEVYLFMPDSNDLGEPEDLVATGRIEINSIPGWGSDVKWCCRIDSKGINHLSDRDQIE